MARVLALSLSAATLANAGRVQVTPVQQVLNLLTEMKTKAEKAMATEQQTYATYKEWVSDHTTDLGFQIKTGLSDIEQLKAFITKSEVKINSLAQEISVLDGDIARLTAQKNDATSIREGENAEYVALQQDYSESVDALDRAIQVLSAENYDRPQTEALLQKMAKTTPGMTRVLAALVQTTSMSVEPGAPEVAAYKFQSQSILSVLQGLLEKFKRELDKVETEESNADHAYQLEMIHLGDVISKAGADRETKAALKASTMAAFAKGKGDLANTQKELAADKALKSEVEATFAAKSNSFEQNQQVRKDELEAVAKAIEIISNPNVASSYSEHINLAQSAAHSMPTFLQLRSSGQRAAATLRVVEFLRKRASAIHSKTLATLASQAAANPFEKVITMIEDLLAKLKEEASAEADHKAWCDQQLKDNKLKRNKRTASVRSLTAQVEEYSSNIDTMGKTIERLAKEQAELAKAMSEATAQRTKEKATNEDTIADAQAGAHAVQQALIILKEFYSSQAALLQSKQVPEMAAYKGLQGSNKGVVGLLEVIETDFRRLESETKAAETEAAQQYEAFMTDAKADKLRKHNEEVKLRLDKDQAEFEKEQLHKDLASEEEQLQLAKKYFEYLKPNCLEIHVSYEERVQRRKEEIAALKEAYGILDQKGQQ